MLHVTRNTYSIWQIRPSQEEYCHFWCLCGSLGWNEGNPGLAGTGKRKKKCNGKNWYHDFITQDRKWLYEISFLEEWWGMAEHSAAKGRACCSNPVTVMSFQEKAHTSFWKGNINCCYRLSPANTDRMTAAAEELLFLLHIMTRPQKHHLVHANRSTSGSLTSRQTAAICPSSIHVSVTTSVKEPPAKYSITTHSSSPTR